MQDYSIILNRLKKNLKQRKSLIKSEGLTAFRLYEKDIPEYPYIIDIYNDNAVIYEKGKSTSKEKTDIETLQKFKVHRSNLILAIKEVMSFDEEQVIFKKRDRQKGNDQYTKIAKKEIYEIVTENKMKLRVNLHDYLDTGLFLDHRPLRKIINSTADGKKVLNLFSYTGSISVAAALGGGITTTVDMSKKYIQWAQENFTENNLELSEHKFLTLDCLQFLKEEPIEKYDIIIFDPPSFSNSKKMEETFTVQEFHEDMIKGLITWLNPNGVIYFSNNFRKFKISETLVNDFNIKDITYKTIPKDFRDQKIHQCFEIRTK